MTDEVGAVDRPMAIVCRGQLPGPSPAAEHPAGQAAHRLQPIAVRVEEDELVHHHPVLVVAQAVDQLRRIGTPATDHGYLRPHEVNVTSPRGPVRGWTVIMRRALGELILAVDGGASKTDAWLVGADGSVLGSARGPGSNHQLSGLDAAMESLGSTVDAALGDAGLGGARPHAVGTGVYCLAGVDLPVDEVRLDRRRGVPGVDHRLHRAQRLTGGAPGRVAIGMGGGCGVRLRPQLRRTRTGRIGGALPVPR